MCQHCVHPYLSKYSDLHESSKEIVISAQNQVSVPFGSHLNTLISYLYYFFVPIPVSIGIFQPMFKAVPKGRLE